MSRSVVGATDEETKPVCVLRNNELVGEEGSGQVIFCANPVIALMAYGMRSVPVISTDRDQPRFYLAGNKSMSMHWLIQKCCSLRGPE